MAPESHPTDRPSATAYLIADSTVFVSRDRRVGRLVPARAAELSAEFAATRPRLARGLFAAVAAGRLRPLGSMLERLALPGIQLHYALRKRLIEEVARRALAEGFGQVVVLGAGFDTLALRLHEDFPSALFVEADRHDTQSVKRRVVEGRRLARENLRFVALDLAGAGLCGARAGAGGLLVGAGFDAASRALFVAEGVLMYLDPRAVTRLFDSVRGSAAAGSLFVFTFMETGRDGRPAFRGESGLAAAWLRARGEPFRWGLSPASAPDFLAGRGFRLRAIFGAESLRRLYLEDEPERLPLAEGEHVCVAEFV